MQGLDYIP